MQFGKAFSFVFEDKDWFKKLAIMGLISLIPILGQIVLCGWMIDVIKKVIRHEVVTLPDLDFGGQLSRGFGAVVIGFVYALPIIVLSIIQSIIMAATTGGMNSDSVDAMTGVVLVVSICFGILYFVYAIVLYFIYPIAFGRYADTGAIGDGLKFGEVFGLIKKAPGAVFIALLGALVASFIAPLGSIACVVGVLLTMVYSSAITGHLFGQAYNVATGN
jgi:hypothetical protein